MLLKYETFEWEKSSAGPSSQATVYGLARRADRLSLTLLTDALLFATNIQTTMAHGKWFTSVRRVTGVTYWITPDCASNGLSHTRRSVILECANAFALLVGLCR